MDAASAAVFLSQPLQVRVTPRSRARFRLLARRFTARPGAFWTVRDDAATTGEMDTTAVMAFRDAHGRTGGDSAGWRYRAPHKAADTAAAVRVGDAVTLYTNYGDGGRFLTARVRRTRRRVVWQRRSAAAEDEVTDEQRWVVHVAGSGRTSLSGAKAYADEADDAADDDDAVSMGVDESDEEPEEEEEEDEEEDEQDAFATADAKTTTEILRTGQPIVLESVAFPGFFIKSMSRGCRLVRGCTGCEVTLQAPSIRFALQLAERRELYQAQGLDEEEIRRTVYTALQDDDDDDDAPDHKEAVDEDDVLVHLPSPLDCMPSELVLHALSFHARSAHGQGPEPLGTLSMARRRAGRMVVRTLRLVCRRWCSYAEELVTGVRVGDQTFSTSRRSTRADVLAMIERCPNVASVSLRNLESLEDADVARLQGLRHLRALNLGGCFRLSDGATEALAGCRQLEVLNVATSAVSDAGLARLARLPRLRNLNLFSCHRVTLDGVRELCAGAAALATLNVRDTEVGVANVPALQALCQAPCEILTGPAPRQSVYHGDPEGARRASAKGGR